MLIRAMTLDDLDRVIELEHQLFKESSWSKEDYLYEIYENTFSFNFVLEIDNIIVGYVGVWIMYEQSQITTIGIDNQYQRQGYAKTLMDEIIQFAVEEGCEVMSLEVRVSNQPAISLYEKCGFVNQAIRKNYYQDNHEDAYLMVKRLEGLK
ncbi:MAG: ribosomal protein S18-alanine N-acetyltransferase [Coprobacillus sp.]